MIDLSTLAGVAAVGVVVFLVLRGVHALVRLLPPARRRVFQRLVPIVEVIAAIGFLLFAVPRLIGSSGEVTPIALALVVALVFGVSWASLRDVAAGVVFRASAPVEVGDTVRVDTRTGTLAGRVVRVGYRVLELETDEGEEALIPMSAASRASIHRLTRAERVVHRFQVSIPEHLGAGEARERARSAALLSHWSAIAREPEIREVSATELDIKVFALAPSRGGEIEADVRRALAL